MSYGLGNYVNIKVSAPALLFLTVLQLDIKKKENVVPNSFYIPGIYAEGYIVFVFPFVCMFVCSYFRPVRGITLQSLYNATRYNSVLVITRPGLGSQMVISL